MLTGLHQSGSTPEAGGGTSPPPKLQGGHTMGDPALCLTVSPLILSVPFICFTLVQMKPQPNFFF